MPALTQAELDAAILEAVRHGRRVERRRAALVTEAHRAGFEEALGLLGPLVTKAFDAGKHPRGDGKFSSAGGGGRAAPGTEANVPVGSAHVSRPPAAPKHKFSSTQVELPPEIGDRLKALAASIPDAGLGEDGREDDAHVTVKYGLHTDDPEEVRPLLAGGPVKLRLGKVSCFYGVDGGKDYDVLKVDVDSPDLHRLNRAIADNVECTDTYPEYKPHATIAYVKAGLGDKYAKRMGTLDADAVCDRVVFIDRDGNRTEMPLGAREATAPVLKAITHAPKGGVSLAGKHFAGGMFIPAADMAKATPAEKKELEAKHAEAASGGAIESSGGDVPSSGKLEPHAELTPTHTDSHDPVAASHDAIRGHMASAAPDRHKHIADILSGHTVAELHDLKKRLGLKASGTKADVVNKLSLRAAGMTVPTQGYTGRLLSKTGDVQIWQNGKQIGTLPADNPSAGHKERVPVEAAHATLQAMHADGTLRTPEGRQKAADMMTHQMTLADLKALRQRLEVKGSGRKSEQVQKLLDRAGVAINLADAREGANRSDDTAGALAKREPDDGFRTDAHAVEAGDAADEKLGRMRRWQADKPGSVAAEEAVGRALGRVAAGRNGTPAKPVTPRPIAPTTPAPDGLEEMSDAEMHAHLAEMDAKRAEVARHLEERKKQPKPARPAAVSDGVDYSPLGGPLSLGGLRDAQSKERAAKAFEENKHPRDRGKFSSKPGGAAEGEAGEELPAKPAPRAAAGRSRVAARKLTMDEFAQLGAKPKSMNDVADRHLAPPDEVAKKTVESWVSGSTGLLPQTAAKYNDNMSLVLSNMPPKSRAKLAGMTADDVEFYPDVERLTDAYHGITGRRERGLAGFVHERQGIPPRVHIDGGPDTDPAAEYEAKGTYAHELAHVIDADSRYTATKEWKAVWQSEIVKGKTSLGTYALESPAEGFAELYRAMHEKGPAFVEAAFPKCHKYLTKQGLL